ncbi:LysR family transcriptional regulator [Jeotgalibacillus sp. R-1-5s-1]|uniref:LysR family transcriptional regulator n=1 Tax=Jeotgalibacillus sp. R-1-5s-1 TaxID=2555897 RepID=UPI001069AB3D|nr:LysR family transcriptional regulator [Jeotgalibacillus sp. R-1-5s-1]TFE00866.1 LysR family transcriptional regulator [Jeotgalibacillus sp. R-1-5s-1]
MDQQLQIFITVAEQKSFSKAASTLHMTQSAVSQHIRAFEEKMGSRLLERTNKYVRLNQAGEIVLHHAKEMDRLYQHMRRLVDDVTNQASGPLTIGASYTFGEYVLPPIIAKLHQLYPDIQPSVEIGNTAHIADLVSRNHLDIGIVEGHFKQEKSLSTTKHSNDEMVIVASSRHPLAKRKRLGASLLADQLWICREEGSGTREAAEHVFKLLDISPSNMMIFSSTQAIKEAVESGLGVTLLSKWAIKKELARGDLVMLPVKGLPFKREFSIVTASSFQTKALQVFISLLVSEDGSVMLSDSIVIE